MLILIAQIAACSFQPRRGNLIVRQQELGLGVTQPGKHPRRAANGQQEIAAMDSKTGLTEMKFSSLHPTAWSPHQCHYRYWAQFFNWQFEENKIYFFCGLQKMVVRLHYKLCVYSGFDTRPDAK